jgi:hypothetical protein
VPVLGLDISEKPFRELGIPGPMKADIRWEISGENLVEAVEGILLRAQVLGSPIEGIFLRARFSPQD